MNRDKTSADEIESAYYALNGAINYIASIDTNEESSTKNDISVEGVIATAGSEDGGTYGSNIGKAEYVLDKLIQDMLQQSRMERDGLTFSSRRHIQLTDFVICQDRLQLEPWSQLLIMRFMLRQQIQRIM